MPDLIRDLRYTLRRLAHTPVFTLAVLITLALAIGANTAVFSVINSVLLKPLPYPDPDRLIAVWQTAPGVNIKDLNASVADYITYREHSRTFAGVAIWNGRTATVTEFPDPERVDGISATSGLLPVLGMQPALGRGLNEKDCEEGSPEVVLLGYGYWQRRFGGDPKVIGRRIKIDGGLREIVGVLPRDFWFMDVKHDLLMPFRFDRATVHLGGYNSQVVARLRPGVTIQQANADVARIIDIEMQTISPPKGLSLGMLKEARIGPNVRLLINDLLGDIGKNLWLVMATIGMVLLIACANVANLLLVRAEGRAQELAVRAALGAGRARIARELLLESVTLALIGGALGCGFAVAAVKLVLRLSPTPLPRFEQISVDFTALVFTAAVSLAAGVILGAIPVLRRSGLRLGEALRAGGRNASAGRERNAARNTLTVVQVALALVLLIGSGLMIRTFQSMRRVNPGFSSTDTLQTLRVTIPKSVASKEPEVLLMQHDLVDRLSKIPGVAEVSIIGDLPMTGSVSQDPIFASDHTYAPNQIPTLRRFVTVAPATFHTFGIPLLAGREFSWTDIHEKRKVLIIDESFAREYWGSPQAALGKQISPNPTDAWREVIGVVGRVYHDGPASKPPATVYWPMDSYNSRVFLLRSTRAGLESFSNEIRQTVWSVNRNIPITSMRTMKEVYEKSMSRTSFTLALLALSGGMALLLAAVGIYAVVSYSVAQKTREIGIRMALGAQQSGLRMMFVRRGLLWSGVGAAAGLTAAAALSRLMSTLLFQTSPVDPLTYALVAFGLLASAAIASYLPARRATRVDPVEALRAE